MEYRAFCALKFNKKAIAGALFALALVFAPVFARADSYGDGRTFNIDKTYDTAGRTKLSATLVYSGTKLYFYIDNSWWDGLAAAEKTDTKIRSRRLMPNSSKPFIQN